MDRALSLRDAVTNGKGCTFSVVITADYQDVYFTFKLDCQANEVGDITFSVKEPESICGITGNISAEGGKLTFDDQMLVFPEMIDGQITPLVAPWLFLKTLRGGYITGCAQNDIGLLMQIKDTYFEDALQINIQTNADVPVFAELIWEDRRIMTLDVEAFRIL